MSYTFVDMVNTAATASASTIGLARTVAVGDNLIVLLIYSDATGTATCADTLGNTYTQLDALDDAGSLGFVSYRLYYCNVTVAGSTTITATLSAAHANRALACWKYQGCSGTPVDTVSTAVNPAATTTDGVKPSNGTPNPAPALVFGVSVNFNPTVGGTTLLVGTGMTSRGNISNADTTLGTLSASGDKRVTSTAATSSTFTNNSASQQIDTLGLIWSEATLMPPSGALTVTGVAAGITNALNTVLSPYTA